MTRATNLSVWNALLVVVPALLLSGLTVLAFWPDAPPPAVAEDPRWQGEQARAERAEASQAAGDTPMLLVVGLSLGLPIGLGLGGLLALRHFRARLEEGR